MNIYVIFQTLYILFTLLNLIFIVLIMFVGEPLQWIYCSNLNIIYLKSLFFSLGFALAPIN